MTKAFELQWRIPVHPKLLEGSTFDRWTEDKDNGSDLEEKCLFKVDSDGFFIFWKSEGREGDVLDLSQVNDIRPGERPNDKKLDATLNRKFGDKYPDQAFIICSGLDMVNLNYCHVVCPDVATANVWKEGLRPQTNSIKKNNICPMSSLQRHWKKLLLNSTVDGKVAVKTIAKTFASGKTEKLVYQTLADCGLPNEKGMSIEPDLFTFEVFYKIYQAICPRTDIEELFKSLTKTETVDCMKLAEFMNDKQRDGRLNEITYPKYGKKRILEIINKFEPSEEVKKQESLSREGLIRYMMSDENAPVYLERLDIYQDMDQPLCKYYINSSHNTYLSGKQFGGKSTVEMYRQSLLAGCRCVELDCWNGDEKVNFEPIITHGKAMCTDIMFKDSILAIRDCAFVTSDYPVILSLENHCNRQQQLKMAKYMEEIFGDLLLKDFLKEYPMKKGVEMPPPSALKRKILLKNKRLKLDVEKAELELYLKGELQAEEEAGESATGGDAEKKPDETGDAPAQPAHTGATTLIHPLLSSFINYITSVKFTGFDEAFEKNETYKMSSFAETTALGYLKSQALEFVNYNKRQISRIYPKGARVDSSNYMPQVFWNSGCQLVALNFQTPDLPMQLNQGKFEYNGGCGYLLKPEFMCREDKQFDPFAETPVDGVIAAQCEVRVISGQFLSDKKVGTYVEVDMYGLPADTIRKEFRTKVVPANGLNPVYNEDPFCFRKVVLPELAVLRFGVYDDNDKLLGQRILPFNDLQMGYRHIALRTEGNFPMALPMLFCQIDVKIYVPDGLGDFMDALSDPRAFLSAQEKRAEQLKALGIQENDIGTDVIEGKKKPAAGKAGAAGGAKKEEEKKEEIKFDPVTPDMIKKDKGFVKANKKYSKEYETLKKKQNKEIADVTKKQCTSFEKQAKGKKIEKAEEVDAKLVEIVKEQTAEWTELMNTHRKAEWDMVKIHLKAQEEIFKKHMEVIQAQQIKELEASFERDEKEMKAGQAKISVETAKDVQTDATLKTKAEKDRRLREKNQANTKKFIDERKNMGFKQNRVKEKLKKTHAGQIEELAKWVETRIRLCDEEAAEIKFANKREAFV